MSGTIRAPRPMRELWLLAGPLTSWDEVEDLRRLREKLAARGWQAQAACLSGPGPPDALAAEHGIMAVPTLDSDWLRPWAVRRFRAKGGSDRPALLHALRPAAAPAALALAEHWRVPYLLTINEFFPPGGRLRLSGRWCRGLIASGADLADDLSRGLGVPPAAIRVVTPGLEPGPPVPPAVEATDQVGVPVIGSAGPLSLASGVGTFLNAARRVLDAGVDAEFVIAGHDHDGGGEVEIRRRAERLGIDERVTLALDPALRPTFWRVLSVYCQPSHVPTYGMPLLRAMSRGRPVIASDVPGLRSHLRDPSWGRLVPPEQSEPLARGILDLLADPEAARKAGQAARRHVASAHDPGREADLLAARYAEAAAEALP